MAEPVVVAPGGGEVIGDSPDRRVEVLADHDALHVTWSRFGPGRKGADLHVHRRHTDVFYVLAGELTIRRGPDDERLPAPAGTLVRVPPLVAHGFDNASAQEEVRYLNVHAPGEGFADYLRALRDGREPAFDQHDPPPGGGRPGEEATIGTGEVLTDEPDIRVALLADGDELVVTETSASAGRPGPPRHRHRRHAEAFAVLAGELAIEADGATLRVPAGGWALLPAGVAHTFTGAGVEPVRFLNLHAPGSGFGAFLRALCETGGDTPAAIACPGFDEEAA
jgi:mannose-6-phosphate isomerase-like protein (cupin superfamily)